jgi:hypothetical protein
MRDQPALTVVIERRPGLLHRRMGPADRCAPWPPREEGPGAGDHRLDGLGLAGAAVMRAPVLRRPRPVRGGQPGEASDLGLQPFAPRGAPVAMAHGRSPASHGHAVAGGLGPGAPGHGHGLLGRHHQHEPLLRRPPHRHAIPKPPVKDHLVPARLARQVGASLRHQGPPRARCVCVERHHCCRHGALGGRVDQHEQLPALDGDLHLVSLAARVGPLPLTGDVATACLRRRRPPLGGRTHPGDLGGQDPSRRRGVDAPRAPGRESAPAPLDEVLGHASGPRGPVGRGPWRVAAPR